MKFISTRKLRIFFPVIVFVVLCISLLFLFYRMLDKSPEIEFIVDTANIQTLDNLSVEIVFTDDRGLSGPAEVSIMGGPAFTTPDWQGKSGSYRFQLAGLDRSPLKDYFEKLKESKSFILQATVGDTAGQKTTKQILILNLNSKP